jgi:hypothetical protein
MVKVFVSRSNTCAAFARVFWHVKSACVCSCKRLVVWDTPVIVVNVRK